MNLIDVSESILLKELFDNPYDWEKASFIRKGWTPTQFSMGELSNYYSYDFESGNSLITVEFEDQTNSYSLAEREFQIAKRNIKDFEDKIVSIEEDEDGEFLFKFIRDENMIVEVNFFEKPKNNVELSEPNYDMTNKNDALRIMATVIDIIKHHTKKFNIFVYEISGSTSRHSRAYKKIIDYMVRKEGYQMAQIQSEFFLLRTKERIKS